jgi:hypothetical protein
LQNRKNVQRRSKNILKRRLDTTFEVIDLRIGRLDIAAGGALEAVASSSNRDDPERLWRVDRCAMAGVRCAPLVPGVKQIAWLIGTLNPEGLG